MPYVVDDPAEGLTGWTASSEQPIPELIVFAVQQLPKTITQ